MNTQTISVDFPNDILFVINESEDDLKKRIKLTLAIQLYHQGKLTIGKAAQLSGLSRFQFEIELSRNQISISNLTQTDISKDIDKLIMRNGLVIADSGVLFSLAINQMTILLAFIFYSGKQMGFLLL